MINEAPERSLTCIPDESAYALNGSELNAGEPSGRGRTPVPTKYRAICDQSASLASWPAPEPKGKYFSVIGASRSRCALVVGQRAGSAPASPGNPTSRRRPTPCGRAYGRVLRGGDGAT